ncbi:DUF3618 domain-containing protein [Streptomyces sp. NPDC014882]|uniref:DUF3618 domain-containing protein n=1 Tax=Streptomyces sp. NPDC014882 TaxID=3364927 RepID=UPI0036F5DA6B
MTDRAAADGAAELRRQIAQTRSQLGATVEELAAKTDLRGRAKARAADLRDRAGAMTVQLRSTAAQAGHTVQEKAKGAGHTVQDRAGRVRHTALDRAKGTRHELRDRAALTGEDLRHTGSHAEGAAPATLRAPVRFAARHPRPVVIAAAAGVALVAAGVLGRRRRWARC